MRSPAANVGPITVKVEVTCPRPRGLPSSRQARAGGRFPDPAHNGSRHPDGCPPTCRCSAFRLSIFAERTIKLDEPKSGRTKSVGSGANAVRTPAAHRVDDCPPSGHPGVELSSPAWTIAGLFVQLGIKTLRPGAGLVVQVPEDTGDPGPWWAGSAVAAKGANLNLADSGKAGQAIFEGRATRRSETE